MARQSIDLEQENAAPPLNWGQIDKAIVNTETLAQVFNCSPRTVYRLAKDHDMPRASRNEFHLGQSVRWYVEHLITKGHGGDDDSITEERRLLVHAQRLRIELELQTRRGELIDGEAVGKMVNEMSTIFSTHLESLAGRLSTRLAGIDIPAEISKVLTHEARAIRSATSAAVLDYAAVESGGGDPGTAPGKKRRRVGRRKTHPAD